MGLNLGSRLFEIKDSGQTLNKESRTDRIIHFNQFNVVGIVDALACVVNFSVVLPVINVSVIRLVDLQCRINFVQSTGNTYDYGRVGCLQINNVSLVAGSAGNPGAYLHRADVPIISPILITIPANRTLTFQFVGYPGSLGIVGNASDTATGEISGSFAY